MSLRPNNNQNLSLKKISLKVWPLREEIKAVIEEYVKQEKILIQKPELSLVTEEYINGKIPGMSEEEKDKTIVYLRHPELDEKSLSLGQALLSEIHMDNVSLFSQKKFIEGQSIVIEFLVPQKIVLYSQVIFCHQHAKDGRRIINQQEFNYRVVAKNTFFRPGERTLLRRFISSFSGIEVQRPQLKIVE